MTSASVCESCGGFLDEDSGGAICSQCLVEKTAAPQIAPGLAETQQSPSPARFQPPSASQLDALIPGIEVTELIGRGGMGAVYRGRQISLDRDVAIKILPQEIHSSDLGERFQREAQTLAKLHHPNVVSVFDFGQADDLWYIVMEYVDGVTLRETIRSESITPEAALKMIPVICDALQFAHSRGVVHRDIKPENILVDREGQLKIADFGLAKLVSSDEVAEEIALTGTQQIMGTAKYMAPEQMSTSKSVDHRADIYSLGVVFYELLTGEAPMGYFQPPSKKADVDVRLDDVVLKTLESEPDRRYQQASEIKTAIEDLSRGPAPQPAAAAPTAGTVQLHKLLDVTETKYRTLHSVTTLVGMWVLPLLGFFVYRGVSPAASLAVFALAVATFIYSVRIKRHQVFEAEYKGHTIRLDNGGMFSEKLYLDDGLVQTGGVGTKMEFRFPIKVGQGTGDEIIIWFDAGFRSTRCRIEVESKG